MRFVTYLFNNMLCNTKARTMSVCCHFNLNASRIKIPFRNLIRNALVNYLYATVFLIAKMDLMSLTRHAKL